jgi:hypothetical protein
MTADETKGPDWDRHDWAGEEHPADEKQAPRWNDKEWAGEKPEPEAEASEGEAGPTGGGHTPGEQHWVPEEK